MRFKHDVFSWARILLSLIFIPATVVVGIYWHTGVWICVLFSELLQFEWDEHPERYDLSDKEQWWVVGGIELVMAGCIVAYFLL